MKAKYFLIILFVFFLLNAAGALYAIADNYPKDNNSMGEPIVQNAQIQSQMDDLKSRRHVSSSFHRIKGNLSLANSAQALAKMTQSPKLQIKEQLRINRKNVLIKMLASRPIRKELMMVNTNQVNNEQ